jgi:uncharacterized protein (DUF433 family)
MVEFNKYELEGFAKRAADAYLGSSVPMNDTIVSLAEDQGLNPEQVQRVVENANTIVNGQLVKRARVDGGDPRISYERATADSILASVQGGSEVAKIASDRRDHQTDSMFQVKEAAVDKTALFDAMFGPKAEDPHGAQPAEVDPELLAMDYAGKQIMRKNASGISIGSLSRACEVLDETRRHARTKNANLRHSAEQLGVQIRAEVHSHLMSGVSPATMRDVVKQAKLEPKLEMTINSIINTQAKIAERREGTSVIGEKTIINTGHPLLAKFAEATDAARQASKAVHAESKLANAYRMARKDLNEALKVSRGRG